MTSFVNGFRPLAARARLRAVVFAVALAAMLLGFYSSARPATGRWTPSVDWTGGDYNKYAVHLVLLPGDGGPYHSRVLWWRGEHAGAWGGQLGWKPGNDGCDTFPSANFDDLGLPASGVDIFCAGQIQMSDQRRLMVIGGTDTVTNAYGEIRVRIFTPGSGSAPGTWSNPELMKSQRWYPGSVALRDGRLVAMSGDMHRRHSIFGGRTSLGQGPQGDSLYRFAPVNNGAWEPALIPDKESPTAELPVPREGHSAVVAGKFPFGGQVYFGGRNASGDALDDSWILRREANNLGSDYRYWWAKRTPISRPARRSEHCAVVAQDTMLVVYGGLDQNNAAIGEPTWRLRFVPGATGFKWDEMVTTGTGPGARFGHAAVYDTITLTVGGTARTVRRMIVFGGASDPGAPADTTIYELRFDPQSQNNATWYPMTQVNLHPGLRGPAPRSGHSLTWDPTVRNNLAITQQGHAALMYGGALGGGAYSDSLWVLWTFPDSTVGWQLIIPDSLSLGPGPRARHSAAIDPGQGGGRLYIFGGETSSLADAFVHVVDPWRTSPGPHWMRWDDAITARTRHSGLLDAEAITARTPEVYDPATGHWTTQTSAPLAQQFYPPTFLVPGGSPAGASRVVTLGGDITYWTDFPASGQAGAWQQLGTSALGFFPQGGVLYRPGRIMVAGGAVTGQTKTLDASSTGNNWVASGSMEPRYEHNLVGLPDGKVIAVGGVNSTAEFLLPTHAVHRPQIWDPGTGTWTPFTGPDTLAEQPSARTYHSTAILLPDGRVLSAGGEAPGDQGRADLYCPPYLFKSNGVDLAARPVMNCAPGSITWGKTYTVPVADTTLIRTACLIRPGATTHAHDQNQRYVPLTFTKLGSPPRLQVTVRANPDSAPPGYYMLFLTGLSENPDVPSIARWVNIGSSATMDVCDTIAPATNYDFAGCPHYGQGTGELNWTAMADDGSVAGSGAAAFYEIRKSSAHITSSNWNSAQAVVTHAPAAPGAPESLTVCCLGSGKWYFRMKTWDDNDKRSALSNETVIDLSTYADCFDEGMYGGSGGGGGGGSRARIARDTGIIAASERVGFVENSLLDGVTAGGRATDLYRLGAAPVIANGAYQVRLREAGRHTVALDAARLWVVDHTPGVAAHGANGTIVLGGRVAAKRVIAADGTDVTVLLDGSGEFAAPAGEVLSVELESGADGSASSFGALLVEARRTTGTGAVDSGWIAIQVPDGSGDWRTLEVYHPRKEFDELAVASLPGATVRLQFLSECVVRFVGCLAPSSEQPTLQWASLLAARSTDLADARSAIETPDGVSATLAGPDTLMLGFSVPPQGEGQVREFFLLVDATVLTARSPEIAAAKVSTPVIPTRFALHQNQPNPFRARTTIRFDLPVGAMVRLEVYDVLGRRVRVLANGWHPPGFRAVEWDKRDEGGNQVGPGVYFYRIDAGANRDGKRMLLLPR